MLEKSPPDFASLPSVSRVLDATDAKSLIKIHGHVQVTAAVRAELELRRESIRSARPTETGIASILEAVQVRIEEDARPMLRQVFNLTGTVLHTNLGRAPLPEEAIAAVATVARGASNLEYDLVSAKRGDRDSHLEEQICRITGAEAATVVNNNAAAVMLVLNTLALGREVPVSRGELVEIGGSFRIPEIMSRSGCRLVEVGTTNRTHARDFEAAISADTAIIMKIHTSNYVIAGFTASVPEPELAALCNRYAIPFVNDLGSGTLANLEDFGLPHEPTPMDALRDGADVVTFSGDKLLGGPQAGLIVGRKDLIARIRSNPMKRALRCDKMTIAALSAVLQLYRDPHRLAEKLPTLALLSRPVAEIAAIAERIAPRMAEVLGDRVDVSVIGCDSEIGSGALPTRHIASCGLALRPAAKVTSQGTLLNSIARALRGLPIPVIGRVHDNALILDLRCLVDEETFAAQLPRVELDA
ncbi:MAG: L-seryl-tRNA(Sec) selenium transferase [Hyphomicrobiaceae bacterium]